MRALDFLIEKININPALQPLKTDIKKKVDVTDDVDLLNKIASSLEGTNIKDRIKRAMSTEKDADIGNYFNNIVKIIIDTPGTVEEKIDFAEGLKEGYVDIKKMLSGERVHFTELLVSNRKNAPLKFIRRVFHALKKIGHDEAKGPGEFSLAVLSPQITIMGLGDLKIGKRKIELKASAGSNISSGGGRLGSTGNLHYEEVPDIIKKYLPNANTSYNFSIGDLEKALIAAKLPKDVAVNFGRELFGYIFKSNADWLDFGPLVNAMATPASGIIKKQYMTTAYRAYRGPEGSHKFEGILLMNFASQELQYYDDPEEMAKDTFESNPYLVYNNNQQTPRLNLPQATLKQRDVEKRELPSKTDPKSSVNVKLKDFGEYLVQKARKEQPMNDDLWDPELLNNVIREIQQLYGTVPQGSLAKSVISKFPVLARPKSTTPPLAPELQPQTTPVASRVRKTKTNPSQV